MIVPGQTHEAMRPLPLDELRSVLDKLPEKYAAIAALGTATGCRITEILLLRRKDVVDDAGHIRKEIRPVKLKARRRLTRDVEILPYALPYVMRHLSSERRKGRLRKEDYLFEGRSGRPLSRITCWKVFRRHLGPGYGTHWMRKTYSEAMFSAIRESGEDQLNGVRAIQRSLGHSDINTTLKYIRFDARNASRLARLAFARMKDGK